MVLIGQERDWKGEKRKEKKNSLVTSNGHGAWGFHTRKKGRGVLGGGLF